ncbi:Ribosome-recycling factor [Hypsizygus marmoreus]|uniref:Ribosome-recycling factor n=1 Tax=Hypsizygus marmoreus TaxID=39966 RepID=A0A369J246_HYPMA|nr:Ribosome-recycling factor [Hypsizygus marmoreus]
MSLLRLTLCVRAQARLLAQRSASSTLIAFPQRGQGLIRTYASAKKQAKSTATLVPGSRQPITDKAAQEEYAKAEASMKTSVEWYRKECAMVETRASGRITPALLSPVRVKLPGSNSEVRLEEVATVGVREGSTLLITVFEEDTIKYIEQALYDSKIAGVVPQRQDNRTIKIPIPKPTVEARLALFTTAQRKAEEIRVQVRKQHQTSLKRGKYEKHSVELEEFQKLTDRYVGEIDNILASLKKATGAK